MTTWASTVQRQVCHAASSYLALWLCVARGGTESRTKQTTSFHRHPGVFPQLPICALCRTANLVLQAAAATDGSREEPTQEGEQQDRLAVLIPYRDRPEHLQNLLAVLSPYLRKQGTAHDVFVLEQVVARPVSSLSQPPPDAVHDACAPSFASQTLIAVPPKPTQSDKYLFNKGALLNAGALLLLSGNTKYD